MKQEIKASYILPEFSIEAKDDLSNSIIELTVFKTRSQWFKRNGVVKALSDEEKVKFSAILDAIRYGRDDPMYTNGPISKKYEEIGYFNISKPSGKISKYWIECT